MDVKIHNAKEAVKACGTDLRWVSDSVAQMITDFDAELDVPPDRVVERIIEETIWKIEEVPCGWCIFWGHPEWVKNMRETGKPGDAPYVIGGLPFMVNRWTGKSDAIGGSLFPTWNAEVQNYIYHLPEDQQSSCQLPEFRSVWKPDPIRFWPPILDEIQLNKIDDLEDIRFTLEIDEAGQNLLVGNEPNLAGMPPLRGGSPYLRACSMIDVKQEGATKTYIFKPEFDKTRLRPIDIFSDRIGLSICESEIFPVGVWLYFQARIGKRDF